MSKNPIDLRTIAGKRYRIGYDESRKGKQDDPWLLTIPARHGHFYPHSGELIGVATNSRSIGLRVAKLPGVAVWQEACDGFNLVFPPRRFGKVAALVKPRRKRQVSAKERQRLAKAGAATRIRVFSPGTQSDLARARGTKSCPVDTLAV